jgi:hypothetical protein
MVLDGVGGAMTWRAITGENDDERNRTVNDN